MNCYIYILPTLYFSILDAGYNQNFCPSPLKACGDLNYWELVGVVVDPIGGFEIKGLVPKLNKFILDLDQIKFDARASFCSYDCGNAKSKETKIRLDWVTLSLKIQT